MSNYVEVAGEASDRYLAALAAGQENFLNYMSTWSQWAPKWPAGTGKASVLPGMPNAWMTLSEKLIEQQHGYFEQQKAYFDQQKAYFDKLFATMMPQAAAKKTATKAAPSTAPATNAATATKAKAKTATKAKTVTAIAPAKIVSSTSAKKSTRATRAKPTKAGVRRSRVASQSKPAKK